MLSGEEGREMKIWATGFLGGGGKGPLSSRLKNAPKEPKAATSHFQTRGPPP